jgi:hypothetical protein
VRDAANASAPKFALSFSFDANDEAFYYFISS